jgi:hypothetical protein
MKRLVLIMLMMAQPAAMQSALAQAAPAQKPGTAKRADACAPIGRTEDGKLVYAMKCDNIPKPVAPAAPPQASAQPTQSAPEPEPEAERGGLFGWSYDRRPK